MISLVKYSNDIQQLSVALSLQTQLKYSLEADKNHIVLLVVIKTELKSV